MLGSTGLARAPLTALANGHDLDRQAVAGLLEAMKARSKPVKPRLLGSIGRASGVVTGDLYALVVSMTIVSFILSAILVPIAPSFGNWVANLFKKKRFELSTVEPHLEPAQDVIIIGFGPAGQIAARELID